jgi:disulfide oxidoreductase YuzD
MYCATCNQCACANCVTYNHTGHTFQDLKALLDRKRQEIKTTLNQVDSEFLPKLRKQLESIPGDIREHKQNIDYLKLEVQKRGQRLK